VQRTAQIELFGRRTIERFATVGSLLRPARAETLMVGFLGSLALGLRIGYYLIDPTSSVDEAQLSLNLISRSYSGLFDQLNFNQAAPPGFLLIQKLAFSTLGSSEYAFRAFPLLSSLVSLILFYLVAINLCDKKTGLLALVLFTISEPLLFYAATNKPYSSDVAVALTIYGAMLYGEKRLGVRETILLAAVGALAVWLSYPAVFVLAGIGTVLLLDSLLTRQWPRAGRLLVIGLVWGASFFAAYTLTQASLTHIQRSFAGSPAAIVTADVGASGNLTRFQSYGGVVRSLLGIPHFGATARNSLAVIGVLLGVVGFATLLARRPTRALLLVAPAFFAVLASSLGKYPLYGRTLLFLIPALLLFVAYGVRVLTTITRARLVAVVAVVAFGALVAAGTVTPVNHLRLRDRRELKQTLQYLAENQRPRDSLYVFPNVQYDLRYYLECGCFAGASTVRRGRNLWPLRKADGSEQSSPAMRSVPPRLVVGNSVSTSAASYAADFAPLVGRPRVWVLLAAAQPESRRALISFLNRAGTRKESYQTRDGIAAVYLYDLNHCMSVGKPPQCSRERPRSVRGDPNR
jgi:Dolichyl-phosphate-mannose-protein mannosyltransferase